MSYQRSDKTAEEAGINSGFTPKNRHNYVDKFNLDKFYIVLPPLVEGYEPMAMAYHIAGAVIEIPGKKDQNGEQKTWKVRHKCTGKFCPKCKENRAKYGRDFDTPQQLRKQTGQIFMVYQVYPNNEKGVFGFGSEKKPAMLEYRFRYNKNSRKMECEDWENLMDEFFAVQDKLGKDPTDPRKAVVFEVTQERVTEGEFTRTVFRHKALDQTVELPEDYAETIQSYYSFDELYLDLSEKDVGILVETSAAIDAIKAADAEEYGGEQAKQQALLALHQKFHDIENADFKRILEGMEKKEDESSSDQKPASSGGGYARQSNDSLSSPATVSAAEAAPQASAAESKPAASEEAPAPTPESSSSGLTQNEKLAEIRARLKAKPKSDKPAAE